VRLIAWAAAGVAFVGPLAFPQAATASLSVEATVVTSAALEDARRHFYNGRYEEAATLASDLCGSANDLEACELRTSTLHFQIRRAMGDAPDREQAWAACARCPELMDAFVAETRLGQTMARERLRVNPQDEAALFLLGKIDLNYVWLQLGTRGRKTGWSEYREARKSLEQLLELNPEHVRGRVAWAWIDYIVGTKMPRGTRWILGGGNKNRGLRAVRTVAAGEGSFFDQAEAGFALWEMQVREQDIAGAVETARELARDFPDNRELVRFLERHAPDAPR
jgi:tetratricopeptide (TPR) repeat protein